MMVKRVSYFTFIVAITTIATVSSCQIIKEKNKHQRDSAAGMHDQNSSLFVDEKLGRTPLDLNNTLELAKVLQQKGIKTGKFKIASITEESGAILSIYFVFDKDYKGQVSAQLFEARPTTYNPLAIATENKPLRDHYNGVSVDKRLHIASKNLILLE